MPCSNSRDGKCYINRSPSAEPADFRKPPKILSRFQQKSPAFEEPGSLLNGYANDAVTKTPHPAIYR
jgi:hypothetical protein